MYGGSRRTFHQENSMRAAFFVSLGLLLMPLAACGSAHDTTASHDPAHDTTASHDPAGSTAMASDHNAPKKGSPVVPRTGQGNEAIFAGGCFWCMEAPFDKLEGVISTTSGYTAGSVLSPTYEQVSSGSTGHTEAIRVLFDPKKISYEQLLEKFWKNIDPVSANGQFCDRGTQYRSGIYYLDAQQKQQAEASKQALEASGKLPGPIVTEIVEAGPFYAAEDYHQDFYKKDPLRYTTYRMGCGRDRRLEQLWGSSH